MDMKYGTEMNPIIQEVFSYEDFRDIDFAENGDAEKINGIRVSGCDDGDYIDDRRSLLCQNQWSPTEVKKMCRHLSVALYGVEWVEIRGDTVNRWVTLPLPPSRAEPYSPLPPFVHCWVVSFGWR